MTDKERLEEIETKYSTLTVSSEKNGKEYTEVDVEDLVFLIQNGFKQAERVQELEEENNQLNNEMEGLFQKLEDREPYYSMKCLGLEQQNKRYREAIEVAIHNMSSDNLGAKYALGILEQALEGGE